MSARRVKNAAENSRTRSEAVFAAAASSFLQKHARISPESGESAQTTNRYKSLHFTTRDFFLFPARLFCFSLACQEPMRQPHSYVLRDNQVAKLEEQRKALGLSRPCLLQKFEQALSSEGAVHTLGAAKMRLDRVFNSRLRRAVTEPTLIALASALDWSFLELEEALGLNKGNPAGEKGMELDRDQFAGYFQRDLSMREITFVILLLIHEIPPITEQGMTPAGLAGIYQAVEGIWRRGTELLRQWPRDFETNEPIIPSIHEALSAIFDGTLQAFFQKHPCPQASSKEPKNWPGGKCCKDAELMQALTLNITHLQTAASKLQRILLAD
jgi:hypothetical protein